MADLSANIVTILEQALIDAREGRFTGLALCGVNGAREHLTCYVFDDSDPRERALMITCAQSLAENMIFRGEALVIEGPICG